ncbi:peptidoglycan DD-metalloendopeptidase family protein [Lentzea sp.]|uniref:peptidoglycan DD-metalloendopeptidase family protein n=1 Tax=Lentzea sp. TaxID=56099 RepID=UPI002D02ECF7|nr:peptidoglycan DD-metalloendopeptidase family protein [Lentzea sp.]HUQ54232.1 peptidoglycan DD-metalloendopeptidase family protein [Lentzea sp.]
MPLLPAALVLATLLTPPAARFTWPLPPPHPVVRAFEAPATPFGPGHRGVDLAAAAGTAVLAAGDGAVVYAGAVAARTLVSLEHRGGLRTTYEPVIPAVKAGSQVRRGEVIGHLQAGHCPSPCLHWGARRGHTYLDPLRLMSSGRVRLLPLNAPARGS